MNRRPALSRCARVRAGLSRVFAAGCSLALAASLIPIAPALAEEVPPLEGASPTVEEMLAAGSYVEGEALVVYRADATQPHARTFAAADPLADAGFAIEDSWDFTQTNATARTMSLDEEPTSEDPGATIVRVTKPGADTAALLEELQTVEGVLAVAPNYVHKAVEPAETHPAPLSLSASATVRTAGEPLSVDSAENKSMALNGINVPSVNGSADPLTNDPLLGLQWALDNTLVSDNGIEVDSSIDLSAVYARAAASNAENIVAVIDTGIDYNHEDLSAAMWENPGDIPGVPGRKGTHGYDFVDGDDDPRPVYDTHGTVCAGIAAASSNNAKGISGVSPKTKIMALRLIDENDSLVDANVIACYEYVLRAKLGGQNVVAASNSWKEQPSAVVEYAINQAGRAGVLSVFGAANDNEDANAINSTPLLHHLTSPYLVSVAATSPMGTYAEYSNHGQTVVDVAAPGSTILAPSIVDAQNYIPAVAKLLDDQAGTPGTRSLYYYSLVNLLYEGYGATIALYNDDKTDLDQGRLSIEKGAGADGREAFEIHVENMVEGEYVRLSWPIENPFKDMTWEEAREARIAVLPGLPLVKDRENNAFSAYVIPQIWGDTGVISTLEPSFANEDSSKPTSVRLANEWLFNQIQDQDTIDLSVYITARFRDQDGTASFTLSDFGIGFPSEDQSYEFASGTSMATPMVAGAVGLLASLYPEESALELRGRIVGGTKALHDAASGDFPWCTWNYDATGKPKQTATNGTLDLSVAAENPHPNVWGVHEGEDAGGNPAAVLEGYNLGRVSRLSIDGFEIVPELQEVSSDGMQLTVSRPDLLDNARHTVKVSDGVATHTSALVFPNVDGLAFEHVIDLPDSIFPEQVGFESGILIAGADRLFCLDAKGHYLYSCDPHGSQGWVSCTSPIDAGCAATGFRLNSTAVYANGKLYLLLYDDEETGDPEGPYRLSAGVVSYDIASDSWDTDVVELADMLKANHNLFFLSAGLASYHGNVCLGRGESSSLNIAAYDPLTGEAGSIDLGKAYPEGSSRALVFGNIMPLMTIGDKLCFVGFMPTREDEVTDEPAEYALTLATYDGEKLDVLEPGDGGPRCNADEKDAFEGAVWQAMAATGDSVVFTGASAKGLGDVYQVNATTGEWTSLGTKAPEVDGTGVASACFYRGSYYVLAAGCTDENGRPTTSLYRLPDEVELTPNDHTASAEASEGGRVEVRYDALAPKARGASGEAAAALPRARVAAAGEAGARAAAASKATSVSQVTHVALGDTVTWTATPDEGYTFAGWYDQNGAMVSKDAVYQQPVTADVTLTARFALAAGPTPPASEPGSDAPPASTGSDTPLAGTGSDSPSDGGAAGGAASLAPTGDPLATASGAFALLAITGVALCLATRSIRHPGRK